MSILDIVLIGIISLVMGLALGRSIRNQRSPGCGGDCSRCCGCSKPSRKRR